MQADKPLKLLHALLRAPHTHHGVVALEKGPCDTSQCVREIATSLDWRVEVLEAPQINLNDLDHKDSPLSRTVRHAVSSDNEYVTVFQGAPPEAMMDEDWRRRLERLARMVRVVIAMKGPPAQLHGWKMADLR